MITLISTMTDISHNVVVCNLFTMFRRQLEMKDIKNNKDYLNYLFKTPQKGLKTTHTHINIHLPIWT